MKKEILTFEQILEVEDSLQEAGIFTNGFNGRPYHSDSYMTVVDFVKLLAWFKKTQFSKDKLNYCVDYWTTNENMQPPLKLVGLTLQRELKKNGNDK